jgi:apolipoprotein N-acyltransferase
VDPKGTVLADLPLFEKAAKFVSVPVYPHTETFYALFGDWFPALLALLILAASITSFIIDKRHSTR